MDTIIKNKRQRKSWSPVLVVTLVVLAVFVILLYLPLVWGIATSVKTDMDFRNHIFGWPKTWAFSNFALAFSGFFVRVETVGGIRNVHMVEQFAYSLLYAGGCAFFATYVPCHIAYLTAKFRYRFSKILTAVVIVCLTVPVIGALPSEVRMTRALGLYDHMWGMWILKANFLSMYFLMFQGVFGGIPNDFAEAAQIDGASHLSVYFRVVLPLVAKMFLTVYLLNFIAFWNDYQTPLIFMPNKPTLAYGLYLFDRKTDTHLSSVPVKFAGAIMVILPVLTLFLIFQKRLMGNVAMGGLKI